MTIDLAATPTGIGRVRAWVWVGCGNGGCASFGLQRQVYLRRVALGVVELPHRLLCEGCGFDLGFSIWEAEVPKIHVGREPTHREDIAAVVIDEPGPDAVDLPPGLVVEDGSAGDSGAAEAADTAETAKAPKAVKKTRKRTGDS